MPYNSQDLTLSLDAAAFFSIVRDSNDSFVLKVTNEQAVEGNYKINVQILIQNGSSSSDSFTIQVPVTLIKEIEALVETENEESATEKEEIKYKYEVNLNVQPDNSCLPNSNLLEFAEEHNKQIKKPHVSKVSSRGKFELKFDKERLIEVEEDVRCQQQSDTVLAKEVEEDDSIPRVYGKPKPGEEPLSGIAVYLEVSEMSDPDKLQFTYSSGDFSQEKVGF